MCTVSAVFSVTVTVTVWAVTAGGVDVPSRGLLSGAVMVMVCTGRYISVRVTRLVSVVVYVATAVPGVQPVAACCCDVVSW